MSLATYTRFVTVKGHEIGRTRSGGWSQSYVLTPEGRIGLIDSEDMPVDSYMDITPNNLDRVIGAVWRWQD